MSVVKQLQAKKSVNLIRASKTRNVSSFVLLAFSALTLLVERRGGATVLKVGVTKIIRERSER